VPLNVADAGAQAEELALHLRRRATTLEAVLGRPIQFLEAAAAMAKGFMEALNLNLEAGALSEGERAAAEKLADDKAVVV
jgi:hypothetical protein